MDLRGEIMEKLTDEINKLGPHDLGLLALKDEMGVLSPGEAGEYALYKEEKAMLELFAICEEGS